MAGGSRNQSIGVGPVLRNAREVRGCSFDEAARDTKLRVDQLMALEAEDFDVLPGDVYVRGSIRTYAAYLGVDPDAVVDAYAKHADEPAPPPPPPKMDRIERTIAASRLRDNPRIVLLVAATILVALLGFSVLSRDRGAPATSLAAPPLSGSLTGEPINLALDAHRSVSVMVDVDGQAETFSMRTGETRSFMAKQSLSMRIDDGASLHIVVNGTDLGVPGHAGSPWTRTWTTETGASPSKNP